MPGELESRLRPFGVRESAAVLVFDHEASDGALGELDRVLADLGVPGARGRARGPGLRGGRSRRPGPGRPWPLARVERLRAPGRAAASRAAPLGCAAALLPRGPLRARGLRPGPGTGARRGLLPRPRGVPAPALAPGRRRPAPLLRLAARAARGGGEPRRGARRPTSCCARSRSSSRRTASGSAPRARLFCHRHTLRYRIRRVEELTGRDLGRARDRIEFWLALRGRELVT